MKTKKYVVGFAFSADRSQVLLVRKLRPDWQKDLLNGIGGKIEEGETPRIAMDRECIEETGCYFPWTCKGLMTGINNDRSAFECHIFFAYTNSIHNFKQKEDEPLSIWSIKALAGESMLDNLNFLIPFGLIDDQPFMRLEYR